MSNRDAIAVTPALQTQTPDESAVADGLEALVDLRLEALVANYEQRWRGLRPSVREWLREVLDLVLADVRRDVLDIMRDLLSSPPVH